MQLTKTDFIHYLNCPKSFWLAKHEPENYPEGEFSVFLQKLIREGYEVERYVRQYFEDQGNHNLDFQKIFQSDDGLFARADGFEITDEGLNILYEVKSSTSVKTDKKHNHIKDACFQKICAERSGTKIHKVYLIHLNGDYVRSGEIEPAALLKIQDITVEVAESEAVTSIEIDQALSQLSANTIDKNGCDCLLKSRANHCDTFAVFNPNIPKPSIYSLPRLSQKKRDQLVGENLYDLNDVDPEYELSDKQSIVLAAVHAGEPQVSQRLISGFLDEYKFPLYFFDYETFASAVPIVDGVSPHKHFPVQYSLHILHNDGSLEHREFLQQEMQLPRNLVDQMEADFGADGSVVSWHASFEKTQNKEMANWFPEKSDFLMDINRRMMDLEDIFKEAYVDARFDGSTSIKKVLPVLCPELGYKDLDVQDGASAMDAWQKMMDTAGKERQKIAKGLLSYCEMDTYAMVAIYKKLASLIK
ncbi:DUF2779 domain-containing protein [Pseudemcibacter aquimaris]|uniref:DUF2779 domain-containing protein n=1 Tax=Pseudemcibacter aquimaris TaxID=2857064 RepID=UPI002011D54C|nr:DUF2779 domain-containing protein [Pseudemcibacter aquimaris]MCC3861781.1 DUF2779 domain-containing protein [Pseudemcibacter aquimaris]WDU57894.1 DUF2779 domain-containing protein [Pseudemcibacter aquimaris]